MKSSQSAVILVAGPTASGKSALAAALAKALHGVVINADAMQVYRGLPVLTAQPDASLRALAPHQLYETVEPATPFSAGQWLSAAQNCLAGADAAGQISIFTGGTGLYFQVLLQGIAAIPTISETLRTELRQEYQDLGEAAIRQRLAAHDAEAATRIFPGDQLRLLRALEIVLTTGRTQRDWQTNTTGGLLGQRSVIPLLLLPPRAALYAACDRRFAQMGEKGAITEVKSLMAQGLSAEHPAMKIIGLRELTAYVSGAISWDEAQGTAQQATRNYAKRQLTWFRNQWQNNKVGFVTPSQTFHDFYQPEHLSKILAAYQLKETS